MAKKGNYTKLVINLAIILLAIMAICTLFLPVITTKIVGGGAIEATSQIKGVDVLVAGLACETSADMSVVANTIVTMKQASETALSTNLFIWSYIATLVACAVTVIFAILSLCGIYLRRTSKVIGIVLIVLSITTIITALFFANEFNNIVTVLGVDIGTKGMIDFGAYLTLLAVPAGLGLLNDGQKRR